MKRAFITGITGQDGSYLTELLLDKGYEVHGLIRRASTFNTGRIDNLGAQSHVRVSFDVPEYSADTDALGVLRILDAVRETCPKVRFYQASTSELYG